MKTLKDIMELNLPLFKKAYELACIVHVDQRRNDRKTPYILHIVAVIENTYAAIESSDFVDNMVDIFLSIAALHDAVEDHPDKINYDLIETALLNVATEPQEIAISQVKYIIAGVKAITKKAKGEEPYIDYVLRVKNTPYARIVKLADLKHNMSDLKPGNMLDKYSVTKYILES